LLAILRTTQNISALMLGSGDIRSPLSLIPDVISSALGQDWSSRFVALGFNIGSPASI
jgi:hypothetical protein